MVTDFIVVEATRTSQGAVVVTGQPHLLVRSLPWGGKDEIDGDAKFDLFQAVWLSLRASSGRPHRPSPTSLSGIHRLAGALLQDTNLKTEDRAATRGFPGEQRDGVAEALFEDGRRSQKAPGAHSDFAKFSSPSRSFTQRAGGDNGGHGRRGASVACR